MIVKNHPEQGLMPHQNSAYNGAIENFEQTNRSAVIMPTGCGKSFVALQLMQDNSENRLLMLVPSKTIKDQMYEYICRYIGNQETNGLSNRRIKEMAKDLMPNVSITLYQTLSRMPDEILKKLNPSFIVMDELHRTGAESWGAKVDELIEMYPDAKILGITATPERMDNINVLDKLFDGKVSYELTLIDALRQGILQPPQYVKCDYALSDSLLPIKAMIDDCKNDKKKKILQAKYDTMRGIVENADGIQELFDKNLTQKDGRYIVFCRDKEHLDEMREKMQEWLSNIDDAPEIYEIYSGRKDWENQREIGKFSKSQSKHIKLLMTIDMLNEGVHIGDVSGVIMLRKTDSKIVYLQQLGRALSTSKKKGETIIFDLVNNYINNNFDVELNFCGENTPTNNGIPNEKSGQAGDIDIFRIQGETKDFLQLLEEVQELHGVKGYLKNIYDIKEWMEERSTTKPPAVKSKDYTEHRLAQALSNIRQQLIKPYTALTTDEEREEYLSIHPEVLEVMSMVKSIDDNNTSPILANAREIKQWMIDNHSTRPPAGSSKNKDEKRQGKALDHIRNRVLKKYESLETQEEKEKFREDYSEVDELVEIVEWIDAHTIHPYIVTLERIKQWMNEHSPTKSPSQNSKDTDERKLGSALGTIRKDLIKPYLLLTDESDKQEYLKKHPELPVVLAGVSEIDERCGRKEKIEELKELLQRDKKLSQKVKEARNLEKAYETQLPTNEKDSKKDVNAHGE